MMMMIVIMVQIIIEEKKIKRVKVNAEDTLRVHSEEKK